MVEFYRSNYKELPNNPSYVKTWYHSDWDIKKIDEEDGTISIIKKSYQGILTGFLGYSQLRGKNVSSLIKERLHISVIFGLSGFFLSYLVCIPLGIAKAIRHGSKFDILSSSIVFIGYSIPGYALGVLLLSLWGGDLFPLHGWRSENFADFTFLGQVWDQLHHAFLPILCYMVGSFAQLTVLMKNSLLENLSQDYVRTAFAKGLSEKRVIFYHAVRNSLIPLATGIGGLIGMFLAGSYLIEMVFGIDGIGMLALQALFDRDYNIIMGNLVIFTFIRLFGNLISDISYAIIDPRIRFK
jgi:microcin C transport system permease protein